MDRLFAVFHAHDIGWLLYNGGNGSMDAVARIQAEAARRGHPLACVGVPRRWTTTSSAPTAVPASARPRATSPPSMLEAGLDTASMVGSKGSVFVMEVMGATPAGWLRPPRSPRRATGPRPAHRAGGTGGGLRRGGLPRPACARLPSGWAVCAVTVAEGIRRPDGSPLMEKVARCARLCPARRRRSGGGTADQRAPRLQVPLGDPRLPAALGRALAVGYRPRAGRGGGSGGGGVRARRQRAGTMPRSAACRMRPTAGMWRWWTPPRWPTWSAACRTASCAPTGCT